MRGKGIGVGGWILVIAVAIVILIPTGLEIDFVVGLYRSSPALFVLGIAAVVAGGGVALWLRRVHREG